jgi:hypothetical protein
MLFNCSVSGTPAVAVGLPCDGPPNIGLQPTATGAIGATVADVQRMPRERLTALGEHAQGGSVPVAAGIELRHRQRQYQTPD